jgi:rubredoxin
MKRLKEKGECPECNEKPQVDMDFHSLGFHRLTCSTCHRVYDPDTGEDEGIKVWIGYNPKTGRVGEG